MSGNSSPYNTDGSGVANDFRAPPLPQSAFPPLPAGGGPDLIVNRDTLRTVASQMAADLARLKDTLAQLGASGPGSQIRAGWATADGFGRNAGNAYRGIHQFYSDLNDAYETVMGLLRKTAGNYDDAEAATIGAVNRISPQAPSGSLTPGG